MTVSGSGDEARTQARRAFHKLRNAMDDAAATFAHEADVAAALLHALDHEPSISALASNYPVAEERKRLTVALDNYETCRRDARIALWQLMLSEGRSIGEISRIFGLSRQLVSRQLRDDRHTSISSDEG
ncbi:MAG: hypothetical protein ACXVKJ_16235 [Ilumatobacteraceae bacterium]